MQHSIRVRNAVVEAITDTIEAASTSARPYIELRTGSAPASCAAASTGTLLASVSIINPNYMAAASAGQQSLVASFAGAVSADGTVGHYRLFSGDGQCDEQGSVTVSGGGGDMELSGGTLALTAGQPVNITGRTLTAGNA